MEQDVLKETIQDRFKYDPETGAVTAKYSWGRQVRGKPVGTVINGYRRVLFKIPDRNLTLSLSKVIWVLVHDRFPMEGYEIDHKDRDRTNYRLNNLQEITIYENRAAFDNKGKEL